MKILATQYWQREEGVISMQAVLGLDGKGYSRGMEKAKVDTLKMKKKAEGAFASMGEKFKSMAKLAAAGLMLKAANDTVAWADKLKNLSANLGISTKRLQAFEYMAERTGLNVDNIFDAMKDLGKNMTEALIDPKSDKMKLFEMLGISAEKLKGMDIDQTFMAIAASVKNMENITPAVFKAMEDLMGGAGSKLLGAMRQDMEGLMKAGEGQIVDNSDIEAAAELKKAMEDLNDVMRKIMINFVGPFASAISSIFSFITGGIGMVSTLFKTVFGGIVNTVKSGWAALKVGYAKVMVWKAKLTPGFGRAERVRAAEHKLTQAQFGLAQANREIGEGAMRDLQKGMPHAQKVGEALPEWLTGTPDKRGKGVPNRMGAMTPQQLAGLMKGGEEEKAKVAKKKADADKSKSPDERAAKRDIDSLQRIGGVRGHADLMAQTASAQLYHLKKIENQIIAVRAMVGVIQGDEGVQQ